MKYTIRLSHVGIDYQTCYPSWFICFMLPFSQDCFVLLAPLGVLDPLEQQNFYKNMNTGQRGSIYAIASQTPKTYMSTVTAAVTSTVTTPTRRPPEIPQVPPQLPPRDPPRDGKIEPLFLNYVNLTVKTKVDIEYCEIHLKYL